MGTVFRFFITCMYGHFMFLEALSNTISVLQDRHLINSVVASWLCSHDQQLFVKFYFSAATLTGISSRSDVMIIESENRSLSPGVYVLMQIKAYVLEGRSGLRGRRRKVASGEYRQLSSTEDVLPASDKKLDPKTDYAY